PADPRTDIGPALDQDAKAALAAHVAKLEVEAKVLQRLDVPAGGHFFAPTLAEIPTPAFLPKEVFGPILHVVRYDPARLAAAAAPPRGRGPAGVRGRARAAEPEKDPPRCRPAHAAPRAGRRSSPGRRPPRPAPGRSGCRSRPGRRPR